MDLLTGVLYLALNVYHEARSEDQLAQMAVAHVTLNRATVGNMSIKEVVLQPYQFSWTHQLTNWTPTEWEAFLECLDSVRLAANGHDFTDGALYYHHKRVIPEWTNRVEYVASFGPHKFYH